MDAATIISYIPYWKHIYEAWYAVYLILSVTAIVSPLIIAAGITGDGMKRIFGGLTAICVGILNWGNIGIAAGNFDKAAIILQDAAAAYPNDQPKLASAFKEANDILIGNGPTLLPQASTTKAPSKE